MTEGNGELLQARVEESRRHAQVLKSITTAPDYWQDVAAGKSSVISTAPASAFAAMEILSLTIREWLVAEPGRAEDFARELTAFLTRLGCNLQLVREH